MPVWDTVKSDSGRSQIGFYYVPEGGKDEQKYAAIS